MVQPFTLRYIYVHFVSWMQIYLKCCYLGQSCSCSSHTHTLCFNSHFPGEPGLAGCTFNSPSPFIPKLCILLCQAWTFHVILSTIPPGLFRASSFNFPHYTMTQSLSSFRSTCPNHLNLLFLIIKLTGSNPKSSLEFSTFLPLNQLNHTHLSDCTHFSAIQLQFMLYCQRPSLNNNNKTVLWVVHFITFLNQYSLMGT